MLVFARRVVWGFVVVLLGGVGARADANDAPVMPLTLRREPLPQAAAMQGRVYAIMQRQARYLLTLVHPWEKEPRFALLTKSVSGEHGIRPNAGMIEGLAFLYRFGPYDEEIVGCGRSELLNETILPMMRYCVATHRTGDRATDDGRAWGDAWQSAHWAGTLGVAAWWTWDDLPEDVRAGARRVVAHEADRIARAEPPHQLRRDTKAEENAWNSQILSVAVLLLPDDPRRPGWERAFQKWAMSAHLRPADERSDTIVDGRTVAEQYTGANVLDDFTEENHGFVHPDYMTSYSSSLGCALHYDLTGRTAPEALLYNVPGIYENMKWFFLPDGGMVYPSGQDWELFRNPIWAHKHLLVAVYAADPDAWDLTSRSVETLEKMQARHPSGMTFAEEETFFPSARTGLFRALGQTWLLLQQARAIVDNPKPPLGVRRLDEAKIVLHRTPASVNTFSWGARIMALCVPARLDRVTSPCERSLVGRVRVAGQKRDLPLRLERADVQTRDDGFTAEAVVMHGDAIRAELRLESRPDGSLDVRERLVAATDVTTREIATGLIGVLNNRHWIYERGERRLGLGDTEIIVPALSGKDVERRDVRNVTIDGVLQIQSDEPLHAAYIAAHEVERGRATDRLYLNHLAGERTWRAGEVISEYRATIRRVERR